MAKMRQFNLTDSLPDGVPDCGFGTYMLCWLEDDPTLKVGTRLTLKETGEKVWKIQHRYVTSVEREDIPRNWHVGGL